MIRRKTTSYILLDRYDYGLELGIFVNDSVTGKPFVGAVWPGPTVWPDFFHPGVEPYWKKFLHQFHQEVHFDGMILDMNEPSNLCPPIDILTDKIWK